MGTDTTSSAVSTQQKDQQEPDKANKAKEAKEGPARISLKAFAERRMPAASLAKILTASVAVVKGNFPLAPKPELYHPVLCKQIVAPKCTIGLSMDIEKHQQDVELVWRLIVEKGCGLSFSILSKPLQSCNASPSPTSATGGAATTHPRDPLKNGSSQNDQPRFFPGNGSTTTPNVGNSTECPLLFPSLMADAGFKEARPKERLLNSKDLIMGSIPCQPGHTYMAVFENRGSNLRSIVVSYRFEVRHTATPHTADKKGPVLTRLDSNDIFSSSSNTSRAILNPKLTEHFKDLLCFVGEISLSENGQKKPAAIGTEPNKAN